MQYIGILSDTHGSIHPKMLEFFAPCDQLWHAGDIGNSNTLDQLAAFRSLKAVYGNIDGTDVRHQCSEHIAFMCEEVKVLIVHIGGYPGHYSPEAKRLIVAEKPGLFVCGHSHILKVIYDDRYELLHINPGAAGNSGFHRVITGIRLKIEGKQMKDLEVLEIQRNSLPIYK